MATDTKGIVKDALKLSPLERANLEEIQAWRESLDDLWTSVQPGGCAFHPALDRTAGRQHSLCQLCLWHNIVV